jgi:hypothetical protein
MLLPELVSNALGLTSIINSSVGTAPMESDTRRACRRAVANRRGRLIANIQGVARSELCSRRSGQQCITRFRFSP